MDKDKSPTDLNDGFGEILPIQVQFGRKVKIIRRKKHITQRALCEKTGFHQNYISDIEQGKRNVTMRVVHRIALALGVEIKELF